MNDDGSSDEDFVTIGKALPSYGEDEVPKPPFPVQQQKVTDSKGRQRFHGAFTGGFSAGYFNTVGSKEGWTPSAFVSSRERAEEGPAAQMPEDFMDDEDLGEHGIAPRNISVADNFRHEDRKRKSTTLSRTSGVIPGDAPLQDLIIPARIPMGIQLLRKLGWKEGQGIGPRLKTRSRHRPKNAEGKKVYGCALPQADDSDSEDSGLEFAPENVTFAPKDVNPVKFRPKDDVHGLGYSGINVHAALGGRGHINLFEPMPMIPARSSAGKRGMTGTAFGVGALEDDDDDVYATESMANYDRVLADAADGNFGWTAPKHRGMSSAPVGYLGKVLEGFKLSKSTLKPKQTFPPPRLPRDFIPHRDRRAADSRVMPRGNQAEEQGGGERTNQRPVKKKMDANVRKAMLGELGSVFQLVSERDKQRMERVRQEQDGAASQISAGTSQTAAGISQASAGTSQATASISQSAASTSQVAHSRNTDDALTSRLSVEEQRHANMPINRAGAGGFKPFAKDAAKQQRYEAYLELKKKGVKYEPEVAGMTEWERQKEREDFARAAALYRPLSSVMASRFTTAKYGDDVKNVDVAPDAEKKDDRKKAVEMKMFGKLTRERYEWHPNRVLCKRFNVANPYPESSLVGVPGGARRGRSDAVALFEDAAGKEAGDGGSSEPSGDVPVDQEKADVKPLALLASDEGGLESVGAPSVSSERTYQTSTSRIDVAEEPESVAVKEEQKERPPMDIFKAIFSNSESSSGSSSDEDEPSRQPTAQTAHSQPQQASGSQITHAPALVTQEPQESTGQAGMIRVQSLQDRLLPPLTEEQSSSFTPAAARQVTQDRLSPPLTGENASSVTPVAARQVIQDSYGPALPPSFHPGSDVSDENSSRKEKRKHKKKECNRETRKEKKKKSSHKKHKSKEKKKKKDKKKEKDRKKEIVISSSSGSEADEDTDSDSVTQPSNSELLQKLKNHPGLKRMTAADFM